VTRVFWLALSIAAFGIAAWADDAGSGITVQGSNYVHFDNGREVSTRLADRDYPDNAITRHFFEDRLLLELQHKHLRAGGRFLYFRPSTEDTYRDGLQPENRFDKRYIEADVAPVILRAGHFSESWGSGLALSCFENRDLYFDSELDGVKVDVDSDPLSAAVLRGTSQDGRLVKKAEITAGHAGLRMFGQSLGFSAVFMDSGAYPEANLQAMDWRLAYGPITLQGERAWNETQLALKPAHGHATYVSSVVTLAGFSTLLEYKDYDYGVATPFQNPAICYREVGPRLLQAREPHVLNVPDEVGLQSEVSGTLPTKSFVTLHYNLSSKHHPGQAGIPLPTMKEKDAPYWELFGSVEQTLPQNRSLFLEIGGNEEAGVVWQKRTWGWIRFTTPIAEKQDVEIESQTLFITDRTRHDQKFTDQLIAVAWEDKRGVSLAAAYELTNDQQLKRRDGSNWPSLEASVSMGGGKHRVIAFYGRERGGLRCSSGVCRQVQAFEGLRITMETSL
jgi:hypothetical protein